MRSRLDTVRPSSDLYVNVLPVAYKLRLGPEDDTIGNQRTLNLKIVEIPHPPEDHGAQADCEGVNGGWPTY